MSSTRTATRKQIWTEHQWRAYVDRLCRVRMILYEFMFKMTPSKGLRAARHLDPFLRAHNQIEYAMVSLENTVVAHLGGETAVPGGAINFCRGRLPDAQPRDRSDVCAAYVKGVARRSEPPLPRETWIEWGAKGLEANNALSAAICDVQCARGDVKRHIGRLRKSQSALLRGRAHLDDLVCAQYPDWEDAIKVFFAGTATLVKATFQEQPE
jgi:hypothetical protein